jgi:hypothetical protein
MDKAKEESEWRIKLKIICVEFQWNFDAGSYIFSRLVRALMSTFSDNFCSFVSHYLGIASQMLHHHQSSVQKV